MTGKETMVEGFSQNKINYCIFKGEFSKGTIYAPFSVGIILGPNQDFQLVNPGLVHNYLLGKFSNEPEKLKQETVFIGEMFDEQIEVSAENYMPGEIEVLKTWRKNIRDYIKTPEKFKVEIQIFGSLSEGKVINEPRLMRSIPDEANVYHLSEVFPCKTLQEIIIKLKELYPCNRCMVRCTLVEWALPIMIKQDNYKNISISEIDREVLNLEYAWANQIWELYPEKKPFAHFGRK